MNTLMSVYFVDETDTVGRITDDFSVEYEGSEDIESFVDRLAIDLRPREEVIEDIIIDMINDLDVREVRRSE